jgi:hypothetical protein
LIETRELSRPETGSYVINGRIAHCVVRENGVRVTFRDGSWTFCYLYTFQRWNPVPYTEDPA